MRAEHQYTWLLREASPGKPNRDNCTPNISLINILPRLVDFLIDKFKASIYDRDKNGSTLMHIAASNGHPETAVLLFNKGVSSEENIFRKRQSILFNIGKHFIRSIMII